jgi:hypothetical protein
MGAAVSELMRGVMGLVTKPDWSGSLWDFIPRAIS